MRSCITTKYLTASSQTCVPTSTTTSSRSTVRTAGSTSCISQSPTLGPTNKLSAPTGWYSTPLRSDCMTQQTQKGASGSRNYPMHSWGFILNLSSRRGSSPISWSTAPKLFYLPT
jgi:hypothetical protein